MPIEGLPNPQIHRMCKRCRQWFNVHEGAMRWPPKTGLLTWVHVTMAESMEQEKDVKFFCVACQELNAKDEARFTKALRQTCITVAVLAVVGLAAWGLGLIEMLTNALRTGR